MKLIIVESPTKAKTIKEFLGKGYEVASSYGHVRDLPKSKIGIDEDFEPQYVTVSGAGKNIQQLKKLAQKADSVLLATDPDREGEAISWHLAHLLKLSSIQRIAFNEITKSAIEASINEPREIDINLVNAQQARRVLDRIVGYKLSPLLWKKITRGLSAGRVQSVALKLIVDREKEINKFQKEEYWSIEAKMRVAEPPVFEATLTQAYGEKLDKFFLKDETTTTNLVDKIKQESFSVSKIVERKAKRKSPAPFITSTLQQEANRRLGLSSKNCMRLAQRLYEKGLTTYHRTDSYHLSDYSIAQAKEFVLKEYGSEYWRGRIQKKKVKGAQEAHEAIRPSYPEKRPDQVKGLEKKEQALYDLIWRRFFASLLSDAEINQLSVNIASENFTFRASGQTMLFDGFLKVYPIKFEDKNLPPMKEGAPVDLIELLPNQHFTQPPARYNEASLIKILEEKGIGRPSTYASIISTIQNRNYVFKNEDKRFAPNEIGTVVSDLLSDHFPDIVDTEFTAKMEDNLDKIAQGSLEWKTVIKGFYNPLIELIDKKEKELNKKELTEKETDEVCDKCGSKMVLKIGRFGNFLACSNYPECKNTKSIDPQESDEPCELCGGKMVLKRSRYGEFWGCSNYPECKNIIKDEERTGEKCPQCGEGEIIKRKSKRGSYFYACSNYPNCKYTKS